MSCIIIIIIISSIYIYIYIYEYIYIYIERETYIYHLLSCYIVRFLKRRPVRRPVLDQDQLLIHVLEHAPSSKDNIHERIATWFLKYAVNMMMQCGFLNAVPSARQCSRRPPLARARGETRRPAKSHDSYA